MWKFFWLSKQNSNYWPQVGICCIEMANPVLNRRLKIVDVSPGNPFVSGYGLGYFNWVSGLYVQVLDSFRPLVRCQDHIFLNFQLCKFGCHSGVCLCFLSFGLRFPISLTRFIFRFFLSLRVILSSRLPACATFGSSFGTCWSCCPFRGSNLWWPLIPKWAGSWIGVHSATSEKLMFVWTMKPFEACI